LEPPPSWPSLAHKGRLLFAQWSSAAADARAALGLADHVRARLPLLLLSGPPPTTPVSPTPLRPPTGPWSACGRQLGRDQRPDVRGRVVDAHLRDVEEELRRAAAARGAMAGAARALGRLAASAAASVSAAATQNSVRSAGHLAPGPAPVEVAETLQDLWRALSAENQVHEAAAARCVVAAGANGGGGDEGRGKGGGGGSAPRSSSSSSSSAAAAAAAADAGWAAALAVLEAEPNVDRARFEAFFDAVRQAWPS